MASYRKRVADAEIERALKTFGAVVLKGPRAVGKTTTGLQHARSSVRLDARPEMAELAEASPETVLAGETPRLVDEWQLAPGLWNAIRHEVDARGEPGQFILAGSAVPADDVTRHSGAGRFRRVRLRPMSLAESGDSAAAIPFSSLFEGEPVAALGGPSVAEYAQLIVRGGWPALVMQPARVPGDYLSSYLDDISRTDLPGAGLRIDPVRMRALLVALARNIATEVPASKLAAEAEIEDVDGGTDGISAQSARKYLDALTRIHVLEEQPAWRPHLRSAIRQRVRPKWHFTDPSLAAALLHASPQELLNEPKTLGFLFESLVIRELRVHAEAMAGVVTHYRDEKGLEVDAIVELSDGRWAAFEVKLGGPRGIDEAARNLHKLVRKVSEARAASLAGLNVVTAGTTSLTRPDGVNVVALGHLAPPE